MTGSLDEFTKRELCKNGALLELSMIENGLSETIPTEVNFVSSLYVIDLSRNELKGNLQNFFLDDDGGHLDVLQEIISSHNNLGGALPSGLDRLKESMNQLDISNNENMYGTIPDSFGILFKLSKCPLSLLLFYRNILIDMG